MKSYHFVLSVVLAFLTGCGGMATVTAGAGGGAPCPEPTDAGPAVCTVDDCRPGPASPYYCYHYGCDERQKCVYWLSLDGSSVTCGNSSCAVDDECTSTTTVDTKCVSGWCIGYEHVGGATCDQAHADCDPAVPGCETLIDQPANCGGCGIKCSAPTSCKASCNDAGACTFSCG